MRTQLHCSLQKDYELALSRNDHITRFELLSVVLHNQMQILYLFQLQFDSIQLIFLRMVDVDAVFLYCLKVLPIILT